MSKIFRLLPSSVIALFNTIDVSDIIDIHNYFMEKHNIKQCLNKLKKHSLTFHGLTANVFKVSDFIKCISLNNQLSTTKVILISLNPDKVSQCLHYYLFLVKTYKRYVPTKTEDIQIYLVLIW